MSVGGVLAITFAALTLAVVTVAVLQQDRAHRRRVLASAEVGRSRRQRLLPRLDAWLATTRRGRGVANRLLGAGLTSWSPTVTIAGVALAAVLASLAVAPLVGRFGAVLVAAVVIAGFLRWLERRREARIQAFIGQLPELARLLSNGAQAGLGMQRSLELAARELTDPAGSELRGIVSQMRLGYSLRSALDSLSARLPSRELGVLVRTIAIQQRSGGALVSALTHVATTLEERRRLQREARTAVAGASFSGFAVMLIGAGSILVMNALSPGAIDELFGTAIGRIVLVVAGALFMVGFLLIRRFGRVEV